MTDLSRKWGGFYTPRKIERRMGRFDERYVDQRIEENF